MEIPYTALSQDALRGVIMEFVTREGTDYGDRVYSLNEKIEHVMRQLRKGEVHVYYDEDTETCNLVSNIQLRRLERDNAREEQD